VREPWRLLDGAVIAQRIAMKKSTPSKLALRVQTIRLLTPETLDGVVGGVAGPAPIVPGFIMKDTIIIRTGG
jgi:hypothetical protein